MTDCIYLGDTDHLLGIIEHEWGCWKATSTLDSKECYFLSHIEAEEWLENR